MLRISKLISERRDSGIRSIELGCLGVLSVSTVTVFPAFTSPMHMLRVARVPPSTGGNGGLCARTSILIALEIAPKRELKIA